MIQHFLAFIIRSTMQYIYVRRSILRTIISPSPVVKTKNKTELHLLQQSDSDKDETLLKVKKCYIFNISHL